MVFTLFGKAVSRTDQDSPVYSALMNGLERIKKEHADRIILTLYESEPDTNATGRWLSLKDSYYYPFETLTDAEQQMILDGKTYTVISLVTKDVEGIISYEGDGVERYHRTHVIPFVTPLKEEGIFNYVTKGGVYAGDHLKEFAETAPDEWTPEAIEKAIDFGIQEYRNVTRRLMEEDDDLNGALKRMDERDCSPSGQIFNEMSEHIESVNG